MTTARDVIAAGLQSFELDEPPEAWAYQEADHLLKALLSAPEAIRLELAALLNPWRPIETAPKDGKEVLLHGADRIATGAWLYHGDYWSWDGIPEKPTHWLPLPAPPPKDKPATATAGAASTDPEC